MIRRCPPTQNPGSNGSASVESSWIVRSRCRSHLRVGERVGLDMELSLWLGRQPSCYPTLGGVNRLEVLQVSRRVARRQPEGDSDDSGADS
jgi:hypothetical protein